LSYYTDIIDKNEVLNCHEKNKQIDIHCHFVLAISKIAKFNLKQVGVENKMSVTNNYTGKCHNWDRVIDFFAEIYFKRNEGIHNKQWCLDCLVNKEKID
jgi:hypothetical protein